MFLNDIEFPISTGVLVNALIAGLTPTWATGLSVSGELLDVKTKRMITVRDDSGPQELVQMRRRQGINLWAAPAEVQQFARDAMTVLRPFHGGGVTKLDQFSGPFEIADEAAYVVGGVELAHFYFTCRASVKGTQPE